MVTSDTGGDRGRDGVASAVPALPAGLAPTLPSGPQRRFLTILFCDLTGSTRLAASMEAEDYAELLAALRALYEEVIPRHGGMVTRIQGDGVLAIFGHPVGREDDGRRAVEAALELHEAVADIWPGTHTTPKPELAFHSGIHSGLVLIDEGDLIRGRVELVGDAPNVAARLSDLAERGEILVSEGSLGPESGFFVTQADGPVKLQGRDEPVHVLRVLGRAGVATGYQARIIRGHVPFCGRDHELRLLHAAYDAALTGFSQRLAVCADAGMGKTRLIEHFLEQARSRGARVLQGYCENYLGAQVLQPVRQWLWSLFQIPADWAEGADPGALVDSQLRLMAPGLQDHASVLAQTIATGALPGAGERATIHALGSAVHAVFEGLASQQPLIVVVDDWQWIDDASRQVLDRLQQIYGLPLLVLLATRQLSDANARLSHTRLVHLKPLESTAAATAVSALLPGTNPFTVANIVRYSGGNPLFLEELCHQAARSDTALAPRTLAGSAWLDSLIEARIESLPTSLIAVLRCAAVIGTVVPTWLLQELTQVSPGDPIWIELTKLDLLYAGSEAGTLRFKHGITRDVVYQGVGARQRRELHQRAAQALQQRVGPDGSEDICGALAYHHAAAGHAAEAARFAELAGDKALASSALDRAQALYGAALQALDQLSVTPEVDARWNSIAQRLGMVCVFDPSRDQLPTLRKAVERARARGDVAALARAEYWLGYIAYAVGDARVAIARSKQALQAARQVNDQPLVVQIGATLGQAHAANGEYSTALQLLDAAIDSKRQGRRGTRPPVGIAYSLACKASVLADNGRFGDAQSCFEEAVLAVQGAGHEVEGSVLCWRSGTYLWQGRWQEALGAADAARQIAQRVHSLYVYAMASSLAAYAAWRMGGDESAHMALKESTGWLSTADRWLFVSLNQGWLAEIAAEEAASGALDPGTAGADIDLAAALSTVRHHTALALRRARQGDQLGSAMAGRAMAWSMALEQTLPVAARGAGGRVHHATDHAITHYLALADRTAAARSSPHEQANNHWCRARIAGLQGHAAQARDWAEQAADVFERLQMDWHLAQIRPLLQNR